MGRRKGDPFLVIGVTGGIGAGKSTVSELLAQAGAERVDADALSRAATEPGQPAFEAIRALFGEGVLDGDGRLNRTMLADIVFADPEKRRALEAVVHARVVEAIDNLLALWRNQHHTGLVVLDVPIPVERGFLDVCDEVWVVESPEALRVERVGRRSGLTGEQVRARIAAQPGADFWRRVADRVIRNDADPASLRQAVVDALVKACHTWGMPGPVLHASTLKRACETDMPDDTLLPQARRQAATQQEVLPMNEPMFERDLLYPTDVPYEPGSVHIRVYAPESDGRMPVHIESKTDHNLLDHLESVMTVMQSDVFDRIRMDIRRTGIVYLYPHGEGDTICVRYNENGHSHTTKIVREDGGARGLR